MKNQRILITGGAGFIGSHLAERVLARGACVSVIDDLSTGRYENVAHLERRQGFQLIIGNVRDNVLMEDLIRSHDGVCHLASAVGVKLIIEQPIRTIETIFNGTDTVLRYCSRYRKKFLLTSSSEVYGKGTSVPFREDDDVLTGATSKHRWAYACAKSLDEFLALAHWRESRLPVAVARLFNTVGPRQTGQYGMVVPRFVGAALAGEPLVVHGDGEQTRCFAHVADVVDGLVRLFESPKCLGQVVNLGSSEEVSIKDLADRIVRCLKSRSKIVRVPYSAAYGEGFEDMRRRVPSLAKAGRLVGYRPKRTLEDIVRDVARDLKGRAGRPSQGRE